MARSPLPVVLVAVVLRGERLQPPRVAGRAGSASGALAGTVEHGRHEVKLDRQRELDRLGWRLETPTPAIAHVVLPFEL